MIWCLMPFSILFQSYQDDGRVILEALFNEVLFQFWKESHLQRESNLQTLWSKACLPISNYNFTADYMSHIMKKPLYAIYEQQRRRSALLFFAALVVKYIYLLTKKYQDSN